MEELRKYDWDCETELVVLTPMHVENVLRLFLSKEIDSTKVQKWANSIERREDIGYRKENSRTLDEMIFWLANPWINYPITAELAERIIFNLKTNSIS